MKFTGHWMLNKFKELEGGDKVCPRGQKNSFWKELKNVSILPEIAATSGGLKALCTYMAWFGESWHSLHDVTFVKELKTAENAVEEMDI